MTRNFAERIGGDYDLESKESEFFLHSSTRRQHINTISIYKCGIMLILKNGVLIDLLYCCTTVQ